MGKCTVVTRHQTIIPFVICCLSSSPARPGNTDDHPLRHLLPFLLVREARQHGRVVTPTETTDIPCRRPFDLNPTGVTRPQLTQRQVSFVELACEQDDYDVTLPRHPSDSNLSPTDQGLLRFLTTHSRKYGEVDCGHPPSDDHPLRHLLPFLLAREAWQHGRVVTLTETTDIPCSKRILRSPSNWGHMTTVHPATGFFVELACEQDDYDVTLPRHPSDSNLSPTDQGMLRFLTTHSRVG
ncbi:hypothetical protein MRX96_014703 [Rhipicephalus microplus]